MGGLGWGETFSAGTGEEEVVDFCLEQETVEKVKKASAQSRARMGFGCKGAPKAVDIGNYSNRRAKTLKAGS
jgi:hypothetical protein